MATAGIQLSLETTNLEELQKALRTVFEPKAKAPILKAALEKAIAPAVARLRQLTPVGPTGNLQRAVTKKVIPYTKSGNAVALIGFTRADKEKAESAQGGSVRRGRELGYHQYMIERGTKDRTIAKLSNTAYGRRGHLRRVRGRPAIEVRPHKVSGQNKYIASSFVKLGRFRVIPGNVNEDGSQDVQTDPGYPRAFFKAKGQAFTIRGVRPGGVNGQPPLKTAWEQTRTQVSEILQQELRLSLSRALDTLTRSATGTIDAFGR
jgi:hypothetical protein